MSWPVGIMLQSAVYVANFAQSQDPSDITKGRFLCHCVGKVNMLLPSSQRGVIIVLQRPEEGWMHSYIGADDWDTVSRTYLQLLNCSEMLMTHFFTRILHNHNHVLQPLLQEHTGTLLAYSIH